MPEKVLIERIRREDVPPGCLGRSFYSRQAVELALAEGQVKLVTQDRSRARAVVHALDTFRRAHSSPVEIMRRGNCVYVIRKNAPVLNQAMEGETVS
jgi:hypothetical protein